MSLKPSSTLLKRKIIKHHIPNAMSNDDANCTIYCPAHCVSRPPKGNWLLAK